MKMAVLAFSLFCLGAAGCISSTVRYAHPASGQVAGREEPAGADDGDFGALLSDNGPGAPPSPPSSGRLEKIIRSYLGTPYRYGGLSRNGIDCSGVVVLVYREFSGVSLPHSSRKLHKVGKKIPLAETKMGDLLFFRMGFSGFVDHVGICTGNGTFVHASSRLGVIESTMDDEHYRTHFVEARRLDP
jgi:cell wall-associated NlpC family hydrolase